MNIRIREIMKSVLSAAVALAVCMAAASAAMAKEFTTTLVSDVKITYLVNTTDKIARVKKVEEGVQTVKKITIPKTVKYKDGKKSYTLTVTGIADEALKGTWFENVELPSTIKSIGKYAFYYASVKKCDLPASLETIGDGAFQSSNLSGTLSIPAGCSYIGKNAFTGTYISSIDFNDFGSGAYVPLTVDEYAFSVSDVQTVNMGRVVSLGEGAFSMCGKLTTLNISGSLTALPRSLCYSCASLTTVGIPVVESIGEFAFCRCILLREFPFMPGLKVIGDSAFDNSGLYSARIKDGCEVIGEDAFFYCADLQTVEMPSSMKSVGDVAFQGCDRLTSISCDAVVPPAALDSSFGKCGIVTIWVPLASVSAYRHANGWRCFDYSHLISTGVDAVESSPEGQEVVRRFDMQGRPIPECAEPRGCYVEVRGGRSRVVLR